MKPKGFITLVIPVTVAGAVAYSIHAQTTPKPLRSFLVTEVMSSPQKGSPYLSTWTSARAVREDGSWVTISFGSGSNPSQNERDIRDFKSGVLTIVDDKTKSIVRQSIPINEHRLAPAVSCKGTPAGQILGLAVNYDEERYQITENEQGDATALVKTWVVPELGCFVLQKQTTWTRISDGVLLVDTKITPISVSFQRVDQFFEIPTSYTERTKAEVLNLRNE